MKHFKSKQYWQVIFISMGGIFLILLIFTINLGIYSLVQDERKKVELWAKTIQKKAEIVNYAQDFFKKIEVEEKKRMEIWAEATRRLIYSSGQEDISFYVQIISQNTTIPVVLTDENLKIIAVKNVDFKPDSIRYLQGKLLDEFSQNPPIEIRYGRIKNYLYYKESILFSELKKMLADLTDNFFNDIVRNTLSVPVVILDSSQTKIISAGNIPQKIGSDSVKLWMFVNELRKENTSADIKLSNGKVLHVYYQTSPWINQIRWLEYSLLFILLLFGVFFWFYFRTYKNKEQHLVWVGMAKETAHQLGTPLSSLYGWLELLETEQVNPTYLREMKNDLDRLKTVAERFSKIGTRPHLVLQPLCPIIHEVVSYVQKRSSSKINFYVHCEEGSHILVPLNKVLFSWVMENLIKNAVDAIEDQGTVIVEVSQNQRRTVIDVIDNGKGIPRSLFKKIFEPGFSTKPRGWGMGLALARRIIEDDHGGKIFVYSSVPGKKTIIRMILNNVT
jgi:nitrogen-specific signal transduction histidine kinase